MVFTEEQGIFRQAVREFAEERVAPAVQSILEQDAIPDELMQEAAEIGLFGVNAPEEFGGADMGVIDAAIVLDEMAKVAPGFARIIGANLVVNALAATSEELAARYIPRIAGGETCAGYGATVVETDADASKATWSEADGAYYLEKATAYTVNANADLLCISDGCKVAFIESGTEGVTVAATKNLGLAGSAYASVKLESVHVPAECVVDLTEEVAAFGNAFMAAEAAGCAEGLFARTLEFCQMRTHDFKPMTEMPAIASKLDGLETQVLVSTSVAFDAAANLDAVKDEEAGITLDQASRLARAARESIANSLVDVNEVAVRLHGGIGYHDPLTWRYLGDIMAYGTM